MDEKALCLLYIWPEWIDDNERPMMKDVSSAKTVASLVYEYLLHDVTTCTYQTLLESVHCTTAEFYIGPYSIVVEQMEDVGCVLDIAQHNRSRSSGSSPAALPSYPLLVVDAPDECVWQADDPITAHFQKGSSFHYHSISIQVDPAAPPQSPIRKSVYIKVPRSPSRKRTVAPQPRTHSNKRVRWSSNLEIDEPRVLNSVPNEFGNEKEEEPPLSVVDPDSEPSGPASQQEEDTSSFTTDNNDDESLVDGSEIVESSSETIHPPDIPLNNNALEPDAQDPKPAVPDEKKVKTTQDAGSSHTKELRNTSTGSAASSSEDDSDDVGGLSSSDSDSSDDDDEHSFDSKPSLAVPIATQEPNNNTTNASGSSNTKRKPKEMLEPIGELSESNHKLPKPMEVDGDQTELPKQTQKESKNTPADSTSSAEDDSDEASSSDSDSSDDDERSEEVSAAIETNALNLSESSKTREIKESELIKEPTKPDHQIRDPVVVDGAPPKTELPKQTRQEPEGETKNGLDEATKQMTVMSDNRSEPIEHDVSSRSSEGAKLEKLTPIANQMKQPASRSVQSPQSSSDSDSSSGSDSSSSDDSSSSSSSSDSDDYKSSADDAAVSAVTPDDSVNDKVPIGINQQQTKTEEKLSDQQQSKARPGRSRTTASDTAERIRSQKSQKSSLLSEATTNVGSNKNAIKQEPISALSPSAPSVYLTTEDKAKLKAVAQASIDKSVKYANGTANKTSDRAAVEILGLDSPPSAEMEQFLQHDLSTQWKGPGQSKADLDPRKLKANEITAGTSIPSSRGAASNSTGKKANVPAVKESGNDTSSSSGSSSSDSDPPKPVAAKSISKQDKNKEERVASTGEGNVQPPVSVVVTSDMQSEPTLDVDDEPAIPQRARREGNPTPENENEGVEPASSSSSSGSSSSSSDSSSSSSGSASFSSYLATTKSEMIAPPTSEHSSNLPQKLANEIEPEALPKKPNNSNGGDAKSSSDGGSSSGSSVSSSDSSSSSSASSSSDLLKTARKMKNRNEAVPSGTRASVALGPRRRRPLLSQDRKIIIKKPTP